MEFVIYSFYIILGDLFPLNNFINIKKLRFLKILKSIIKRGNDRELKI